MPSRVQVRKEGEEAAIVNRLKACRRRRGRPSSSRHCTAFFAKVSRKVLAQTPSRLKRSGIECVILAGSSISALF